MPNKDPEKEKAYQQAYRKTHRKERNARKRSYNQAHREERRAYHRVYQQLHGQERKTYYRTYRSTHQEQIKAYRERLRTKAFHLLGNKCACPGCEVSEPAFLTIDHIYGRPRGPQRNSAEEAQSAHWDKAKFQILCANCNFAKRDRGSCPVHQSAPNERNGQRSDPIGTSQMEFPLD